MANGQMGETIYKDQEPSFVSREKRYIIICKQ